MATHEGKGLNSFQLHGSGHGQGHGSGGGYENTPSIEFPKMANLWYNQKSVKLDGWRFESCRFDNCKLVIETPYFALKNCYIDQTNMFEVQGVLLNAIQFLNLQPGLAAGFQFTPFRNGDGTVSIGG